ncbi:MAG: hypothetical protein M1813_004329 [Trichoglossum hirsutum]|nr:MAG: hypothetical protein M1813_004329 [Trichoglossum hirsutum]
MANALPALLRPPIAAAACGRWIARPLFGGEIGPLVLFRCLQHGQLIRPFSITSKPFRRRVDGLQYHLAVGILIPSRRRAPSPSNTPNLLATFATSRPRHPKPPPGRATPKSSPSPYDPDRGVSFRQTPLTPHELSKIFPPNTPVSLGNLTLRVQHGRRIHGLLDVPDAEFPSLQSHLAGPALAWLRENYPLDEEAAAAEAMGMLEGGEKEEERLLRERAEKLGLYKPQGARREGESVYGRSGLDAIRETYEREAERKYGPVKGESPPASPVTGTRQSTVARTGGRVGELTEEKEPRWVNYYRERARVTDTDSPPEMTKLRRLAPSALLTLLTILISLLYSQTYTAPPPSSRLFPQTPPTATTLLSLIASNALIFALWRFPPLWPFLNRYFISVPGYPYALSLIGNMFSHQKARHLALNMAVLWIVGTRLHEELGRGHFLGLYFASGALASFMSLSASVLRNTLTTSSLGASGAVAGILGAWLSRHADEGFKFLFVPEEWLPNLSGLGVLAVLIGVEVVGILRGWRRVDHWAHLGGYIGGVVGGRWVVGRGRNGGSEEEMKRRRRGRERGWVDKVREGRW